MLLTWICKLFTTTRAKIDQVNATLFAEQRLNNVVIKVQQHLWNWQCWWVLFDQCWQRTTVVTMLLEQELTIFDEKWKCLKKACWWLSTMIEQLWTMAVDNSCWQGAAQHCLQGAVQHCNKLLTRLIKLFIFARLYMLIKRPLHSGLKTWNWFRRVYAYARALNAVTTS